MVNKSSYYENLLREVLDNSEANIWEEAVQEWWIEDVEEDECQDGVCICGKENLRYLFTIRNSLNNNGLYPIGSSCIKKFERTDLTSEVDVKEQLFKLLHAVENNDFLTLSSEYFSRKLLLYLYQEGAFSATAYNNFEPQKDYQFMLNMFNKRTRSEKQDKKCVVIILNSINPYLQEKLSDKIKR